MKIKKVNIIVKPINHPSLHSELKNVDDIRTNEEIDDQVHPESACSLIAHE